MARIVDWRRYVDQNGDFELAKFLYKVVYDLMKNSLDMGTLLSEDSNRLRAYREQVKSIFKEQWLDVAQGLEYFEIIVPCSCVDEFCKLCGGSRYLLNGALTPDEMQEFTMFTSDGDDPALEERLQRGLRKALEEMMRSE